MTKSIKKSAETTLQSLYRYYCEMKSAWYKGDYTLDQEDIYYSAFSAIEKALIELPVQCEEDKKIKLAVLKNIISLSFNYKNGKHDMESGTEYDKILYSLITQAM